MRTRPRHALGNDASLVQAATLAFASDGFDATSMASLSARANLTYGAAYARFDDKAALAASVWQAELFPALVRVMESARQAVGLGDEPFVEAMAAFAQPEPWMLAALELLQASEFEPSLRESIRRSCASWLASWIDPQGPDQTESAVRAGVASLAIGLVLIDGRPWEVDLGARFGQIRRALAEPVPATPLPPDMATQLDEWPFATGDPRLDRALGAIASIVGEVGYHRATITRICRAAGVSTGYLYARYPSKLDLFLAANDILLRSGFEANVAFAERLASEYGPGIAEAVTWREFQRPAYAVKRSLALEANRLARFDPRMRRTHDEREQALVDQLPDGPARAPALAHLHAELAFSVGVYLVPNLVPEVWTLPFDVFTVPLLAD